ncbi:MAG TPA: DUF2000 domain-containing protein [Selenomonadales bacterium]|nr:DUF2000 domain-containing protein [Selenomonadales bacterium]
MFDTKLAVVLAEDLPTWQKLNVTAFAVSGIGKVYGEVVGEDYVDGSGNRYLPMFRQPVLIFSADREKLRTVYERAMNRGLKFSLFTEDLFATYNDADNRAAVRRCPSESLRIVGMAFWTDKKILDKVLKGLSLCQ